MIRAGSLFAILQAATTVGIKHSFLVLKNVLSPCSGFLSYKPDKSIFKILVQELLPYLKSLYLFVIELLFWRNTFLFSFLCAEIYSISIGYADITLKVSIVIWVPTYSKNISQNSKISNNSYFLISYEKLFSQFSINFQVWRNPVHGDVSTNSTVLNCQSFQLPHNKLLQSQQVKKKRRNHSNSQTEI